MMKKLLLGLLTLAAIACSTDANAQTVYRDNKGNIYFEGLEKDIKKRRYLIYYYGPAGSSRVETVWMYPEEPARVSCPVHVIFKGPKFMMSGQLTIVAAPGGDLNFTRSGVSAAPYNANPCTLANIYWKTLRGTIQATRFTQERFPYQWVPKSGPDAGKRITSYQSTEVIYIRGLPQGATYLVKNQYPKIRFSWANDCGFMKLANTTKWPALAGDQFELMDYSYNTINYYTRANLPIRPWQQIPKCFGGKRFVYQP